jgi:hypothetical protein
VLGPLVAGIAGGLLAILSGGPPLAASVLPVNVLAVPSPDPASGSPLVALLVEVPGEALLRDPSGKAVEGEIWAVARDREGSVADAFVQPFVVEPLDAAARGESAGEEGHDPLARTGLKLVGLLRLAPGSFHLQVTVSSAAGRLTGSAGATVEVPDFASGEPVVSAPLFPEPVDRWHVLLQSPEPQHAGLPFAALGEGFLPRAVVELPLPPVERPTRFLLVAYHLPEVAPTLDARLLDLEGNPVPIAARVEQQRAGVLPGERWLRVEMEAQPPMPGVYWLDLGVPGSHRRVRAPLRFAGATPAAARSGVATTTVAGNDPPHARGDAAQGTGVRAGSTRAGATRDHAETFESTTPAALAARYHEALVTFATGDAERAADSLRALEMGAAQNDRRWFEPLRKSQRRVIDELAARPASLQPVIYLHALLDPIYLESGEVWLLAQNRVFVAELVERWVNADGSDEARALGGLLLASLGASHQALAIDPQSTLALLRLAIEAEKSGQSESAVDWLVRLLEATPGEPHARLRLAVALRRLGRTAEASSVLSSISSGSTASGEVPRWIAALAFQEQAMLEREMGLLRRAEATLRRGIEATGVQALYVQLAFYLDLQQRRAEAESILDGVPLAETAAELAPRHRYNGQPEAELAAARERVERAAAERSGELRALLPGALERVLQE